MTVALGEMPNDRHANAEDNSPKAMSGTPHLGLRVSPAGEVEGAGEKGVVVTAIDPEGPAAEHGLQTGDIILNVGGKAVSNTADVRSALRAAEASGKHSVLMHVKTADAMRFVAVPLAKG
jgi:serine protease Do